MSFSTSSVEVSIEQALFQNPDDDSVLFDKLIEALATHEDVSNLIALFSVPPAEKEASLDKAEV